MPVIILLLIGLYILFRTILEGVSIGGGGGSKRPFTQEEIKAMNREMLGKSQKECRAIMRKYQSKK